MRPLGEEFQTFVIMIAVGAIMGISFDLYRAILRMFRPPRWATHAGDFAAWVFMTALVFFLLLMGNWGELRFYIFIGMLLGLSLYFRWLSRKVIPLWFQAFHITGRTLRLLWSVLLFPFRLLRRVVIIPLGIVSTLLSWLLSPVVRVWRWLRRSCRLRWERVMRAIKMWLKPTPPAGGEPPYSE